MTDQNPFNFFNEKQMSEVWEELRIRFGFNVPAWQMRFREFKMRGYRNEQDVTVFLIFGNKVINPLLNQILQRREGHPTFNNLALYVMTGKRQD